MIINSSAFWWSSTTISTRNTRNLFSSFLCVCLWFDLTIRLCDPVEADPRWWTRLLCKESTNKKSRSDFFSSWMDGHCYRKKKGKCVEFFLRVTIWCSWSSRRFQIAFHQWHRPANIPEPQLSEKRGRWRPRFRPKWCMPIIFPDTTRPMIYQHFSISFSLSLLRRLFMIGLAITEMKTITQPQNYNWIDPRISSYQTWEYKQQPPTTTTLWCLNILIEF